MQQTKNNIRMAQTIARAKYACMQIPDPKDKLVVELLNKHTTAELTEMHEVAKGQISAMLWNTMTLNCRA